MTTKKLIDRVLAASRRIGILLLVFLMIAGIVGCSPEPAPKLTVYGFPVGAADAFLITTENSAVLIDCASKGDGKQIVNELKNRGIDRLDCLIVSHFDKDHIGGAKKVIGTVPADHVFQPAYAKEAEGYANYVAALSDAGIEAETVTEDLYFELDGVEYWINPPAGGYRSNESNNASLIVSVTNGKDRLLFMGDAESERIAEFLDLNPGPYDVMKVPHHGRKCKMSSALIDSLKPAVAVITSSAAEPEDEKVVNWLKQAGAEVYFTRAGAVVIESTGSGVRAYYKTGDR